MDSLQSRKKDAYGVTSTKTTFAKTADRLLIHIASSVQTDLLAMSVKRAILLLTGTVLSAHQGLELIVSNVHQEAAQNADQKTSSAMDNVLIADLCQAVKITLVLKMDANLALKAIIWMQDNAYLAVLPFRGVQNAAQPTYASSAPAIS